MVLIPFPKRLIRSDGAFTITPAATILLDAGCDYSDFEAALALKNEIEKSAGIRVTVARGPIDSKKDTDGGNGKDTAANEMSGLITLRKAAVSKESPAGSGRQSNKLTVPVNKLAEQAYKLKISKTSVYITASGSSGLYYGIQTLRQLVRSYASEIPCMDIEDAPDFENRGFYHDITRGRVPTLETLKELADRLSFYKINQLQLYIEHSFAFKKHSEIWIDSDPVTAEEILILDEYCKKKSIELVPSLSTFGHLYHALISRSFGHLNEYGRVPDAPFLWTDRMQHYTLDASNPKSLEFVYEMIDEFLPLFSSDKFNICCDETFDLGQGKNKALSEEVGKGKLYLYFVKNLISYLKSRKKTVMMWGDILLKYPGLLQDIPKGVVLLNWDYGSGPSEENVKLISDAGLTQYVCPGVNGWNKLINDMDSASMNISAMIGFGKKYNAAGVLNTDWGDFGHINPLSCSIPGAIFGAGLSWNTDDPGKPTDEEISILEYGDRTGRLAGVLRELSRQPILQWDTVALWYYTACGHNTENYGYNDHHLKLMLESDENRIKSAYHRIRELEKELSSLHHTVYEDKKADMKEFLVSADGLALFQALLLVIKKKFLGQADTGLLLPPAELAAKLEYWFTEYKAVWRSRNKESELFRIKDVIMGICRLLRD